MIFLSGTPKYDDLAVLMLSELKGFKCGFSLADSSLFIEWLIPWFVSLTGAHSGDVRHAVRRKLSVITLPIFFLFCLLPSSGFAWSCFMLPWSMLPKLSDFICELLVLLGVDKSNQKLFRC